MTTTIARNATRKISAIKDTATRCVAHSLSNDFVAVDVDPEVAWRELEDRNNFGVRLTYEERSRGCAYMIHVHSNLWYEFPVSGPVHETTPTKKSNTVKAPRGVSGRQRELFLSLTPDQREVYRKEFEENKRLAKHCYQIATGQLVYSDRRS